MTASPPEGTALTDRERQVLALIAQGHTEETAADALGISFHTVKAEKMRARKRLGARHTPHAIALAIASRQLPAGVAIPAPGGGELS